MFEAREIKQNCGTFLLGFFLATLYIVFNQSLDKLICICIKYPLCVSICHCPRKEDEILPIPTRVLTIYFKDIPSFVTSLSPHDIFGELI